MLNMHNPAPKRLVYLVSHGASYASNGYAIRTQGIAKALQQSGLEVICLVRPGRPWEMSDNFETMPLEVVVDGVRYLHTRWPEGKPAAVEDAIALSAAFYTQLLKVLKPDLVLAASNFEVGMPGFLAAKKLGLPFAYEVRGFWEISRSSREPAYANDPEFSQQLLAESWLVQQPIPLFTLNEAMRQEIIHRGAQPDRVALVPNGVGELPQLREKDQQLAAQYQLQPDDHVFGFIGSLISYEGLDDLLTALAQLPADSQWKLLLVGEQHPVNLPSAQQTHSLSSQLLAQAEQLGVSHRLCFTGRVPHAQVGAYYALIDTLVLPRKNWPVCQLVMPLKGIEALSFGMQLLVSDVAPLGDLQQISATVQLFKAGDIADLARQLTAMLGQTLSLSEREQMRQALWQQHQYAHICQPMLRWSEQC